jgi:hypothetical protein
LERKSNVCNKLPHSSPNASFSPFSWLENNRHSFAEKLTEASKDLGAGITTVLQLIESSELDAQDETPYLNPRRRSELLRLAITSAQLLAELAGRDIDRRNAQQPWPHNSRGSAQAG